jgi:hypothetical protein
MKAFVCGAFLVVAQILFVQVAVAGPAANGNGQIQDGEAGNKLGAVAADALGLPGAHERLDAMVHDPGMPYGPPAPQPKQQTNPSGGTISGK